MQKIIPYLWFDNNAQEAVDLYVSVFQNSKKWDITYYDAESAKVSGQPEWSILTIDFVLEWLAFGAMNGGPIFQFTPATSFFVNCDTVEEIDHLWEKLSDAWTVLMPIQEWPFSKRFGWLNDKYGVSWQFNLAPSTQKIKPCLMFVWDQHGKAQEAITQYTSLFQNSEIKLRETYDGTESTKDPAWTIKHALFALDWYEFVAMDSGFDHQFKFSQAMSFAVNCETQPEIDRFWDNLSQWWEIQQCGWLLDKYGVARQIVPTILDKLLKDSDPIKAKKTMSAMLQMVKLDIQWLENAAKL